MEAQSQLETLQLRRSNRPPDGRSNRDGRSNPGPSRTRTQMQMLRGVQNERFTFEVDSESAIVVSTLER
jgi:hypothetical protein